MVFEQISLEEIQAKLEKERALNGKIYTKIDWYSAMFQDMSFMDVLKWLQLDCFVSDFLVGMYERLSGFDDMFVFSYEGINLETRQFNFFGEDPESENCFYKKVPKIRLDISGSGLDFLRSLGNYDPEIYLRDIKNIPQPFHCTRCDFAYDLIDYKPEFLDQVIDYCLNNHTDSDRLCIYKLTTGIKYSVRQGGQKTVYLGSSTSDKMLRIYDKRLQYIDQSTGLYKKANDYMNPKSWIRVELQTRNKTAHSLCYGDGDMLSIFRFIYESYCFSDVKNTTEHSRKPADFWQNLFDWDVIPNIVQNANSVQSITPYKERVVASFYSRTIVAFMLTYTALGKDEFEKRITEFLTNIQDFSDPLNVRRSRLLGSKMNMFQFDHQFLLNNKTGLQKDEKNILKFKL